MQTREKIVLKEERRGKGHEVEGVACESEAELLLVEKLCVET
jgi:hypothetical protein